MDESLTIENQTNTDYILEYSSEDKKNFIFLFGGDNRTIKNHRGESNLRISNSKHGLKDFSFFANFPGKITIQKSVGDYDFIYDHKLFKKIDLRFSKKDSNKFDFFKKNAFNIFKIDKFVNTKPQLDKTSKNIYYLFLKNKKKITNFQR